MSLLKEYKTKRDFSKTSEPLGKPEKIKKGNLRFVVQKHAASHLHYDFRLEMEGVLKSWAVPKGPSLNPEDKRLAVMVEDHPFDYRSFEGTIPEGSYGAGDVIVWDEGTYFSPQAKTQKENEKILLTELAEGNLHFILNGHKLKGEFALVRMKGRKNQWLLIKKKDSFASDEDITKKDKSVLSKRKVKEKKPKSSNVKKS